MSRLTLRLPETLHRQLEELAQSEEISLNQYIVYALTRQVTSTYTVQAFPEKAVAQQQATYNALLQTLGEASPSMRSFKKSIIALKDDRQKRIKTKPPWQAPGRFYFDGSFFIG